MTKIIGMLATDDDGETCIKMQISPQNPEVYDIPLSELLEDYMGKRVKIEILPIGTWKDID
ncbi:MAG: hypothetical protein ACTSUE_08660 [Promethearchaeota archaeon]